MKSTEQHWIITDFIFLYLCVLGYEQFTQGVYTLFRLCVLRPWLSQKLIL